MTAGGWPPLFCEGVKGRTPETIICLCGVGGALIPEPVSADTEFAKMLRSCKQKTPALCGRFLAGFAGRYLPIANKSNLSMC